MNIDRKDPRILCFPITLLLVFCLLAGFAYAQPVPVTGTLKTAVPVPLVLNGKQVGSTTLPAGTKVTVVQESAGKTLVKAAIGETWVASDALDVEPLPSETTPLGYGPKTVAAPAATAPEASAPAQPAVTAPSAQTAAPPATPAPVQNAKTVIVLLERRYPAHIEALVTALRQKGYTVQTASQFETIARETVIRPASGGNEKIQTGENTVPDILIPKKVEPADLETLFGKPQIVVFEDVWNFDGNPATKKAAAYLWKSSTEKVVGEIDAKKGGTSIDAYVAGANKMDSCTIRNPKPLTITRSGRVTGYTVSRPAVDKNYKAPTVEDLNAFGQTIASSLAP